MDSDGFDALAKGLGGSRSRRQALAGLVGGVVGLTGVLQHDAVEAHDPSGRCKNIPDKKKRKKCIEKGKKHKKWHQTNACREEGKPCGDRPCCSGLTCSGGRCVSNVLGARQLNVPFLTQMGSDGDPESGGNNCGPASVAMVLRFYGVTQVAGQDVDATYAAEIIRGVGLGDNGGNACTTVFTNFKEGDCTGNRAAALLYFHRLIGRDVWTFDGMRHEIEVGHPVIALVRNAEYRSLQPYESNSDGFFRGDHIVVATGYDASNVYINDPLRQPWMANPLPIPVETFKTAAGSTWYAVGVYSEV